jgi:serine/threonine-protein kinase
MSRALNQKGGATAGRYALHGEIASGGMASVYYGRLVGPAGFSRVVAIKRLHPQLAALPEFVTMFFDEVRLTARIRHPNVVPTLDAVYENGELFLVMEYVHGESLSTLIRLAREKGQFVPPGIATSIVCGLLHGLHAVHEARDENGQQLHIVHRDVSPQNVIVGFDGMARILDFGIAKAAGRAHTTRDGYLKGKMAYLAPEVVNGASTDRRVDVYASAAVLWETLTGGRLFDGENDSVVLARVLEGAVPPPSTFAAGLPQALDAVVLRGLDRDPSRRYPTARDMALALQREVGALATSEVGDWVEGLAHEARAERERQLVALERMDGDAEVKGAPVNPDGSPTTIIVPFPAGWGQRTLPSAEPTTRPVSKTTAASDIAESADETPSDRALKGRSDRGRTLALALSVLTGVGVAAFFLTRPEPTTESARAAALDTTRSQPVTTVQAAPTTTPVNEAPSAAVPPPEPAKTVVALPRNAKPAPPTSATQTATVKQAKPAPRVKKAAIDCQPPFTIDATGVKHFKVECFR